MAERGRPSTGVLVMAYGTPERTEDLEAYYTDIRRGRPPAREQLADLRARYDAIGGLSPLAAVTRAQARGLQDALDAVAPGEYVVALGLKHAAPFVEDGVAALVSAGVSSIVGVVLAPHWSTMSIGQYHDRGQRAADRVPYVGIRSWHVDTELVDLLARRVGEARATVSEAAGVHLLVTAHSLPERAEQADTAAATDIPGYRDQLAETARAVAAVAGCERWSIAFQSAGRTPDPWLGPDVLDELPALAADGASAVVVCPAGFTADHLEVLYDIDVEARRIAAGLGLPLVRTASLNDDPALGALLARLVVAARASL